MPAYGPSCLRVHRRVTTLAHSPVDSPACHETAPSTREQSSWRTPLPMRIRTGNPAGGPAGKDARMSTTKPACRCTCGETRDGTYVQASHRTRRPAAKPADMRLGSPVDGHTGNRASQLPGRPADNRASLPTRVLLVRPTWVPAAPPVGPSICRHTGRQIDPPAWAWARTAVGQRMERLATEQTLGSVCTATGGRTGRPAHPQTSLRTCGQSSTYPRASAGQATG